MCRGSELARAFVEMAHDSDDDSELLAALNAFDVTAAGSSSDSDDDRAGDVDTSAVCRILAGRHSADASDFGALADALQSVASSGIAPAYQDDVVDQLQVRIFSQTVVSPRRLTPPPSERTLRSSCRSRSVADGLQGAGQQRGAEL